MRIKFLKYIDSYRLIYRYEWDVIAVTSVSGLVYFVALTVLQAPLWVSPFFSFYGSYRTIKAYRALVKDAAPGYLYHFFYSIGMINPVIKEKKNGKVIKKNPENIPYGFETDFRD